VRAVSAAPLTELAQALMLKWMGSRQRIVN
jgi:hypothetical protein